jgi:hypothetical protein
MQRAGFSIRDGTSHFSPSKVVWDLLPLKSVENCSNFSLLSFFAEAVSIFPSFSVFLQLHPKIK